MLVILSWLACGFPKVAWCIDHPALGVMLNATLGLDNVEAISVEEDDYKEHFLK